MIHSDPHRGTLRLDLTQRVGECEVEVVVTVRRIGGGSEAREVLEYAARRGISEASKETCNCKEKQ